MIENDEQMYTVLNDYFLSVFTMEAVNCVPTQKYILMGKEYNQYIKIKLEMGQFEN